MEECEAVMELLSADQCAGGQGSLGKMINIDLMKPPQQEYELTLYTEAEERWVARQESQACIQMRVGPPCTRATCMDRLEFTVGFG